MTIDVGSVWNTTIIACKHLNEKLESLKDNIPAEINKECEQDMNLIESNFNIMIQFWRRHLIIAQDAFCGMMLVGIECITNFYQAGAIDTDLDANPIRMTLNPLYLINYSVEQVEALICAEIIQLAMDYPSRFANINRTIDEETHKDLMHAASVSSLEMVKNDLIIKPGNRSNGKCFLQIPSDAYTLEDLRVDKELSHNVNANGSESLEYYYSVYTNKKKDPSNQNCTGENEQSDSNSNNKQSQGLDMGLINKNQKNIPSNASNNAGKPTHRWENSKHKDENASKIKMLVQKAYDQTSPSSRGLMPAELAESIRIMLKPPQISWKQRIPKNIGQLPHDYHKTNLRPCRMFPDRLDKYGKLPDHLVRVVVGLDTSGSVDNETIDYLLSEIFNLLKEYKTEVTLIQCDSEICGEPKIIRSINDWDGEICGRGGTCFTPVFEYVNNNPKFRDALFIYLTDGYGEGSVPKPKVAKMMWIVKNDSDYISVDEPWGTVDYLKNDPGYVEKFKNR